MRRGSPDVEGRALGLWTRDGFPWPSEVPLWHGTTAMSAILRQGFRTRRQGLSHALGGGTDAAVSFTLDPRVAWAIAVGLRVLRRGARREMSLGQLVGAANRQLYHGTVEKALQHWWKGQSPRKDITVAELIRRLDDGWIVQSTGLGRRPSSGEPIGGWEGAGGVIYANHWWRRIEDVRDPDLRRRWEENAPFYNLYSALLTFGSDDQVYNPVFWMTNMRALAAIPSEAEIGVLRARTDVPRICLDAQGAHNLGYLTRREANFHGQGLGSSARACASDLERRTAGGRRSRRSSEPLPWRLRDGKLGPFQVRDTGTRTPAKSMTYLPALAEVRVFDARKIEVESSETLPAWLERTGNHDLIGVPWFSEADLTEVFAAEGLRLPGTTILHRLRAQQASARLKARGYALADVRPGSWKLGPNSVWNVPEGVDEVPFEVTYWPGRRGPPRSHRGLVVSMDGKVFGLRTAHELQSVGFSAFSRVSIRGKKVPVFLTNVLFERPDRSLVRVEVFMLTTRGQKALGLEVPATGRPPLAGTG